MVLFFATISSATAFAGYHYQVNRGYHGHHGYHVNQGYHGHHGYHVNRGHHYGQYRH